MISKLIEKYKDQSGNVYVALLSGIALIGIVGTTTFSLLSGPLSSMTEVNKKTVAKTQLNSIARITILDATHKTNQGDCDSDAYVEPEAGRDSSLADYDFVPYTLGAPVTDPWGNDYAYCVWDLGTVQDDATCSGPGAQRYAGTPNAFTGHADTQKVLAFFSAGPDGTFESTCADYVDDTTAVFTCTGDDICQHYTYAEAATATASYWNLKTGDPTVAETGKKVEVGSGGVALDTTTGAATFGAVSSTGKVIADGGAVLATDSVVTDCLNTADTGLLRYNETSDMLEVCDGTIPDWVEASSYNRGTPPPSGGGGGSTNGFVQTANDSGFNYGAVTSDTTTFTTMPSAGNTILVIGQIWADSAPGEVTSVTDNQGNTYTAVITSEETSPGGYCYSGYNGGGKAFIYMASDISLSDPSGTFEITINVSGGSSREGEWRAYEIAGAATVDQIGDVHESDSSATSTTVTTSGSLTEDNQVVFAVHTQSRSTTSSDINYGVESGWTHIDFVNNPGPRSGLSVAFKEGVASGSTVSHTWTHNATGGPTECGRSAIIASFSSAGSTVGTCSPVNADSEWVCKDGDLYFKGGDVLVDYNDNSIEWTRITKSGTETKDMPFHVYRSRALFTVKGNSPWRAPLIHFFAQEGTEESPEVVSYYPSIDGRPIGRMGSWAMSNVGSTGFGPAWRIYALANDATAPYGRILMDKGSAYNTTWTTFFELDGETGYVSMTDDGPLRGAAPFTLNLHQGDTMLVQSVSDDTNYHASFSFKRARNSMSSPSALTNGDYIGTIAGGQNNTDDVNPRTFKIGARVTGDVTTTSLPTSLIFQTGDTHLGDDSLNNERMRIQHNGRIGIGSTDPRAGLHTNGALRIVDTGTQDTIDSGTGEAVFLYRPENNSMIIGGGYNSDLGTTGFSSWSSGGDPSNPNARCRADGDYSFCHGKSGQVTGTASYILHGETGASVSGNHSYCLQCLPNDWGGTTIAGDNAVASGRGFNLTANADYAVAFGYNFGTPTIDAAYAYAFGSDITMTSAATGSFVFNLSNAAVSVAQPHTLFFLNGKVGVGGINTSYDLYVDGTAGLSSGTTWTLTSDARLKDIHGDYTRGIDDISKLEPVLFSYKKDNPLDLPSDKVMSGFIAQDVQKVFPEAISTGAQDYLQFDIQSINIAMINAVKDLNAEQQALLTEQRQLEAEQAGLHSDYQDLRAEMDTLLKQTGLKSQSAKLRESHIFLAISIPVLLVLVGSGLYRRRNQKSA